MNKFKSENITYVSIQLYYCNNIHSLDTLYPVWSSAAVAICFKVPRVVRSEMVFCKPWLVTSGYLS